MVLDVALAVICDGDRVLISRRKPGTHLEGFWEFPGGKVEPGETPEEAAVREAAEEVGLECQAQCRLGEVVHPYPERTVRLIPVRCVRVGGEARALSVSEVRWVALDRLSEYRFPEANSEILRELLET